MDVIAIEENALIKNQHALIYHLEGTKGFCFKGSVPLDLRKHPPLMLSGDADN